MVGRTERSGRDGKVGKGKGRECGFHRVRGKGKGEGR